MMITEKIIKNILGKPKKGKDSDGDGVVNSKDCQPHNTMRQDQNRDAAMRIYRMQDNLRRWY